jgi:putative GTP pyrophosphokinase
MTEAEILARWENDKPIYYAWSELIAQKICSQLKDAIAPTTLEYFIKVPLKARLKENSTLVDKALYRNKDYENPYDDITDKIGMRFVVLLTSDIKKICNVIDNAESNKFWTASKDRDYEKERDEKPLEFTYQSVHYMLRAKQGISHQGINIPEGTTCEIQIRTLLQHAHSELTHDTLYKPKTNAASSVKRTVAKSMALIEATDEFFEQAMTHLDAVASTQRELLSFLSTEYLKRVGKPALQERSNQFILDALFELLPEAPQAEIVSFFEAKPFIFNKINEQAAISHLFNQPIVLLAYYLASTKPAQTRASWPIDETDLAKIYSDLGKGFE